VGIIYYNIYHSLIVGQRVVACLFVVPRRDQKHLRCMSRCMLHRVGHNVHHSDRWQLYLLHKPLNLLSRVRSLSNIGTPYETTFTAFRWKQELVSCK
jgi:hypothetical protein